MNSPKANKLIQKIASEIKKNGIDAESIIPQLQELRELAKLEKDPVVIRSIRMAYEHLENNGGWEYPVIKPEEDEDGNLIEDAGYTAEEHFDALLAMIEKSDNKYNKDELRIIANELNDF
ncbi:MAG: hypothetical protein J5I91_05045 [Bacteroidetes bacterium]|nr:hypothetical protein [Bacteroidota bacterium]